ncbi:hypothetical protein QTP88_000134 [Uroleucon formosanum]
MATVTLSMEAAIKLIPSFSGGNDADLSAFENKCKFVFSNITENIRPTILNAIIAQLTGKAFEAIRYREFTEWKSTKFYKAGKNERIQDFAGRIEKIYHELTYALTIGKNATESKIIAQTIQGQASSVFMSGVHPAINTILEARAVTTFELAVVIAMEKERNFEDRKSGYDKNKNKNIKNKIKCNRCNKMGHYANEYYSKVTASSGFRNPTYNDIKKENTGQVKFCKYCRKTNHDIKDCRKRIFNENKKKQEGGYTPSNETNRTAGETVFITCDNDKQSINHLLEGVGLFTLNETCKAYATRDILIPGEVNFQEEYLDFIPDSRNKQYKYFTGKSIKKMQQIRQKQTQNDYLLYFMTTLILLGSVVFITIKIKITIKKRQVQNADKQKKEEELPLQPTTTVVEKPVEEDTNPQVYTYRGHLL